MKGFIACALASAPAFQALELTRPLHIALTYDEEVGCLGAPVMLNALADLGFGPTLPSSASRQACRSSKAIRVATNTPPKFVD